MGFIRKILGPKSKYDKTIPYTYEARILIYEGEKDYNSYFSDTVCGLLIQLSQKQIKPQDVQIYGIYVDHESLIEASLYSTEDGLWRSGKKLCDSFKGYYEGHISDMGCSFEDR